jgi:hypothetical protein
MGDKVSLKKEMLNKEAAIVKHDFVTFEAIIFYWAAL